MDIHASVDKENPIMLWVGEPSGIKELMPALDAKKCEILFAASIEDGIEILARQPVDVLLIDVSSLQAAEIYMVNEVKRCWPYLVCVGLMDNEFGSDVFTDIQSLAIPLFRKGAYTNVLGRVNKELCGQFKSYEIH